jgi:succinate dehydrogenase/fumarate reductase flavoprotein subunit
MAGRGTPNGGILLDATHLGEDFLMSNFPGMVERCTDYGFDLIHSRVEVSPSAHYHMGGVRIDRNCRSNLDGLFVAGEDAGGVHGANRLGGNGVADSIVFGARAGDAMSEYVRDCATSQTSRSQTRAYCEYWGGFLARSTGENPFALREELENLMWAKVGVVRNGKDIASAVDELQVLQERAGQARCSGDVIFNAQWNEAINLINLTLGAELIARSALLREESRGAHFRTDFPIPDSRWLKNIYAVGENAKMRLTLHPVEFTRLKPPDL